MSQPKQPVVGEKPSCPKHPENYIDWTCSAGACPYRALCKECKKEHESYYPHHSDQVSALNDWLKQYQKLAKNFDPRESNQMAYHVDEVGMVLKKEKYELEKISKVIDDSFEAALNILFGKLKSLKEFLQESLWKDFNQISEGYNGLIQKFTDLQKFDAKKEISRVMKEDLQKYFSEQNLKEYFDRVYSGHYDEMVFNTRLNGKDMIGRLKKKRKQLEEGFKVFDAEEFEKKWTQELDKFIYNIESTCDDVIFKNTKLDFLNPKSPKLNPAGKTPHSSYITCLSSLEGLSTSFIAKVDNELFMTLSDQRTVNFLDPNQNFRVLKSLSIGSELINSTELLHLDSPVKAPPGSNPASFLAVLGGNDDYPSLEVWDCLRKKNLACLENVHDYGISCLKMLKKESFSQKEMFYVASGSSDGFIKLWQIDVVKPDPEEENYVHHNYRVQISLLIKICAHDSYISSIVTIPPGKLYPSSTLMSCSHDKSLYVWEWERELEDRRESQTGSPCIKPKDPASILKGGADDDEKNANQNYGKKIAYAHTDRINGILLLNDKADYSDLEHYATGGGEGMVKVWNFETGEMVKTFSNSNHSPIFSMEYLKKNRIACTANEVYLKHFYVLVWNWRTTSLLLNIRDHQTRVFKVISLGENVFATCDKSKTIKLWQLEDETKPEHKEKLKHQILIYGDGLLQLGK